MARLLALAVAATLLMAQSGQPASAARASPVEAFWRAALPEAPMPDALLELLHPGTATEQETDVPEGIADDEPVEDKDPPPPMNFNYDYDDYKALPPNDATGATSADDARLNRATVAAPSSTVFFLEDAVRVGESLPFHGTQRATAAAEASAEQPLKLYTVRDVWAVEGYSFVVCRREAGQDAVYGCRATGPARSYVLYLQAGERRNAAMTAVAVCRTDTSSWDPEHAAFRLLGVKPGGAAICHAVPDAQVLPAMNGKSPAAAPLVPSVSDSV